ncbi:aspartate--tRNA(Asn) ligase [Sphaerisporangium sp. TRM90804]|uniref:aspartate--tRNA(Asn) ligase n=1 Tax=Sphaerisporangium sp. TRM90804 TaxID=3031113 RepID=UPI002447EFE8|nr:aspartate--tRNA(Asn) ligase [Sphaerisporangium sp. TRM90804]MDH2428797.1 aspartate--tRNA(Asn) ligase [Sphaerisporangium sp. TRM90804]
MRILSSQVSKHVGDEVTLAGWLHRVRPLKSVTFAVLRDRDGLVQVVAADPELVTRLADLPEETVVEVVGTATANVQAPGGVEITSPSVRALSEPALTPPFDLYRPVVTAALPTVLDNAAVALRHPRLRAPFEITAASVAGFRRALERLDFTEVHTPKVVSSATESGANVFALDWFGRKAYLAQSPQFYKQTMVGVFERVYEVGPVFRAEPHDTARHLAQYTSLDAEMGFVTDHRDVMAVVREAVADMVASVAERASAAVDLLGVRLPDVPREIPAIHFADAQELLARETGEDPRGEPDLAPAHERWLCEWALREHGSEFLFVTGYPMVKRPFYTHPEPGRPEYSNSFDLLFRGLELVTGGQRLHRHSDYLAALEARGESPGPYAGYLAAFAHGMPPHGGFALGLERFVARLTGADNIRWTTLFPRDLHRLAP